MNFNSSEPVRNVVPRSAIPPAKPLNLPKGFWDSVIRHLSILGWDEVMEIQMPPGYLESGRSSLHNAAARAGVRATIIYRDCTLYTWRTGQRERRAARGPRAPIECRVCGKTIDRPRTGASVQFYCGARGAEIRSACQDVARLMSRNPGMTAEQAKRRSKRWQREQESPTVWRELTAGSYAEARQ